MKKILLILGLLLLISCRPEPHPSIHCHEEYNYTTKIVNYTEQIFECPNQGHFVYWSSDVMGCRETTKTFDRTVCHEH